MDTSSAHDTVSKLHRHWAWVDGWRDSDPDVAGRRVIFQRHFALLSTPETVVLRLSADTRYKLKVNGSFVTVGPTRGSDRLWFYDTIDIAPWLRVGNNVVSIDVLRCFPDTTKSWTFARTRLPGVTVLETDGLGLSMDREWRAAVLSGTRYPAVVKHDNFLQASRARASFEDVDPTELEWTIARLYGFDTGLSGYGLVPPWDLRPRMIPMPDHDERIIPKAVRHTTTLPSEWHSFFIESKPLTLPPNTSHTIELEFPCHSTAFWSLLASSDSASTLRVTYSEAYETLPRTNGAGAPTKGVRTEREGRGLEGPIDVFRTLGVEPVEPFWWKAFRFLLIEIDVGASPLCLEGIEFTQTNYPLPVLLNAMIDDEAARMLDVSVRTLRNCVFDGYSDGPFYEQLQFAEDTRSSALFHYYVSGDDRLSRQAIVQFAASVLPDGILHGRYPAQGAQIITGFSLFWVLQVCDHMRYFGDAAFSRRFLPIIDGVLSFFERHVGPYGLVEHLPQHYWSYIDWHPDWRTDDAAQDGTPKVGRRDGRWTYFTLLYAYILRQAAQLGTSLDRSRPDYLVRADEAVQAVQAHCFDGEFYTDSLANGDRSYSQHVQIFAILAGAPAMHEQRRILSATISDVKRFTPCSLILQHYVFRALAQTGLYESYYSRMWEPWRSMLALDLSTWAEGDVDDRSDCHAWSSLPLYEFPAEVAGLTPREPGWAEIMFTPRTRLYPSAAFKVPLGAKEYAEVKWETVGSEVHVELELSREFVVWTRDADGGLESRLTRAFKYVEHRPVSKANGH